MNPKEKDFEEVQWLKDKLEKNEVISMCDFAVTLKYFCEDDADTAFKALMLKSFVTRPTRTALQNNYEIWKRNDGPAFWASQTATLSLTQTASELVAEGAHVAKGLVHKSRISIVSSGGSALTNETSQSQGAQIDNSDATSPSDTSTPVISPSSLSSSSSPTAKKKRARYCTEEPWHSLMISLIKIVNGQSNVSFPESPTDMKYIHGQLFRHAVLLLEEYQAQCSADKDMTLIKDAQVVMSCLLNTM
ncbi:hypothetical protein EDD21DRAFT_393586 [Dissophora ornata]|nr:hypothetical protein EDD21DRAFT_393586 [Dissophora ornata]